MIEVLWDLKDEEVLTEKVLELACVPPVPSVTLILCAGLRGQQTPNFVFCRL